MSPPMCDCLRALRFSWWTHVRQHLGGVFWKNMRFVWVERTTTEWVSITVPHQTYPHCRLGGVATSISHIRKLVSTCSKSKWKSYPGPGQGSPKGGPRCYQAGQHDPGGYQEGGSGDPACSPCGCIWQCYQGQVAGTGPHRCGHYLHGCPDDGARSVDTDCESHKTKGPRVRG